MKRVSQLTGHGIPDPIMTSAKSLSDLFDYLTRASNPKPKKLAHQLLTKEDIINLPNVHIMGRRETPVDKDKQFGRWKIIESELQSRGLPVLSRSRPL
jgi:Ribosomal subunit 39S